MAAATYIFRGGADATAVSRNFLGLHLFPFRATAVTLLEFLAASGLHLVVDLGQRKRARDTFQTDAIAKGPVVGQCPPPFHAPGVKRNARDPDASVRHGQAKCRLMGGNFMRHRAASQHSPPAVVLVLGPSQCGETCGPHRERTRSKDALLETFGAGPRRTGDNPCQGRQPYARLMPLAVEPARRQPGRLRGSVDDEFFEPLPEEELDAWEGR
jgi:hypothetical protein